MTDGRVDKASFAREYFASLKAVMDRIDVGQVAAFVAELERAYREDRQVFIIGNGGSAATASHVFTEQLVIFARPGDLLVVVTGSGRSPNVVNAVRWARQMGLRTAGMLGFDGGETLPLLDTALLVPDFNYGYVEDLHMVLDHLVTAYFVRHLPVS